MYHGAFGMHTGMVLRRLRRLCALYGSNPRFICCSATIGESSHEHFRLTCKLINLGLRVEGRGLKDQRVKPNWLFCLAQEPGRITNLVFGLNPKP